MTERENLPAKLAAQYLAATPERRGSLVARGMAALKKDNDALYRQARMVFDRGDGIRNWNAADNPAISSAFNIFRQLADQNYGKAYYPLSILYGGCQNIEEGQTRARHFTQMALEWCLANQTSEDVELWCDLGDMHNPNGFVGYGVTQSKEIAEAWYRKAAEQGDARGQRELGLMLHGNAQKNEEAFFWMRKAAEQGDSIVQIILGDLYDLDAQCEEAVYWFRKAADQGDDYAQLSLGRMYVSGHGVEQDDAQAVHWFRKAAEQDHERAQWNLGSMYKEGRGVSQDDKQAVYWFTKAAEQGDDRSQFMLGVMYEVDATNNHEQAVIEQTLKRANFWYRKAAEQGNAEAQYCLGLNYAYGTGVEQSHEQAAFWYRKAADQGDGMAQWQLGKLYISGRGVEQDYDKAVFWLCKAAKQDHYPNFEAIRELGELGIDWKPS